MACLPYQSPPTNAQLLLWSPLSGANAANRRLLMRLTNLSIRNFRCIRELSLDLDEITVLIGENNTGKTAVLEAVRACLERLHGRGRRQFDEYDYHLASSDASPTDADPIEIRLSFVESKAEPWAEEVVQMLEDVAPLGPDDRRQVTLQVSSQFDSSVNDFKTDRSFLNADGEALLGTARSVRLLNTLQGLVPVFYLSALRDASRHFTASGHFWRSFLGELGVPEDQRQDILTELTKLNGRLIKAHGPLAEVRNELESAKRVVDFGAAEAVTVEALPTKLFSLLSRAQVQLTSRSGARIPVAEQGEGTQSLAVLLLFGAFLRSQLSGLDPNASAITALEEPEAHLHPSATRALMQLVEELPGQKLISTHSGHMLASVPATAIRRLAYESGDIKAYRIDANSLTDEEIRKFDFHVRRSRGELLFVRCWLLVEGESEVVLLTGAAVVLGLNLERDGVCCVEYSQTDVGMLAKIANQLGIQWYCVIDDDEGRRQYERSVRAQLAHADEADRMTMPYENVELMLCENGFGDIYKRQMSDQKDQPTAVHGTTEYWHQVLDALGRKFSKPAAAAEAVDRMAQATDPAPVPTPLANILNKAVTLTEPS